MLPSTISPVCERRPSSLPIRYFIQGYVSTQNTHTLRCLRQSCMHAHTHTHLQVQSIDSPLVPKEFFTFQTMSSSRKALKMGFNCPHTHSHIKPQRSSFQSSGKRTVTLLRSGFPCYFQLKWFSLLHHWGSVCCSRVRVHRSRARRSRRDERRTERRTPSAGRQKHGNSESIHLLL